MKIARHAQIIQLINQYDIETQEELAEKLNQAGFQVTQATVSRDIRQLKLTKVTKEDGKFKYAVQQTSSQEMGAKYAKVLKAAFVSMDIAQNILVIKLDDMNWSEVVGCIAGDDTIMCVIRTSDDALLVMDKIQKMLDSFQE